MHAPYTHTYIYLYICQSYNNIVHMHAHNIIILCSQSPYMIYADTVRVRHHVSSCPPSTVRVYGTIHVCACHVVRALLTIYYTLSLCAASHHGAVIAVSARCIHATPIAHSFKPYASMYIPSYALHNSLSAYHTSRLSTYNLKRMQFNHN